MTTNDPTPTFDTVSALLADAVDLIVAASEELATGRHDLASRQAVARIAALDLPVEIVRDASGLATIVQKTGR